jgi:hypothetical protein
MAVGCSRGRRFGIMVINKCRSHCRNHRVDASEAHASHIFGEVCAMGSGEHVLRLSVSPTGISFEPGTFIELGIVRGVDRQYGSVRFHECHVDHRHRIAALVCSSSRYRALQTGGSSRKDGKVNITHDVFSQEDANNMLTQNTDLKHL